jgi:ribulose-5-phosphate 4-epimerase/fuculose-1-phosphate aldolase
MLDSSLALDGISSTRCQPGKVPLMSPPYWRGRALCSLIMLVMTSGSAVAQAPASTEDNIEELVVANHVLAKLKVLDAFGHVTIRHPANQQRYLMARSIAPALVTEGDIIEFGLDSNAIDARGRAPSIERFIHGEIYKVRPDVKAIVHSHSPTVIPFSVSKTPLRPISHVAGFLWPAVPVYDPRATVGPSNLLISNREMGKALAEVLGQNTVALIRGHGDVVVATSAGLATYRAFYTEASAQLLLQTRLLDGPITFLDPEEAARINDLRQTGYVRQWEQWKRELNGSK